MIANFGHCEERSNHIYKISFTSHVSAVASFLAMTNWMGKLERKTSFTLSPLAPIVVEILLCRGSAQKIETDSGKQLLKNLLIKINTPFLPQKSTK
jgi:hypothetical protein